MADIVFNVGKGRAAELARLTGANDALVAVPIETTGIEADSVLVDYDTLAALLAASNNEQTTMGRKTLTGVTVTHNDTDNKTYVDADDITWTLATGNGIAAIVICYEPDTTAPSDSNKIPLVKLEASGLPVGSDVVYQVNALGLFSAA